MSHDKVQCIMKQYNNKKISLDQMNEMIAQYDKEMREKDNMNIASYIEKDEGNSYQNALNEINKNSKKE